MKRVNDGTISRRTNTGRKILTERGTYRYGVLLIIFAIALSVAGIFAPTPVAQAWVEPGVQPGSGNQQFWSRTYVDSTGMVHVVWHIFNGEGTIMYARGQFNATATAVEWQPAINLSDLIDMNFYDNTVRIAVDINGVVHVVAIGIDNRLYYFHSPDRGANWTSEAIDTGGKKCWTPAIAVDDSGNAYVTWSRDFEGGHGSAWYTYRAVNGSWRAPIQINTGGYLMRNNRIAVNAYQGQVYVHIFYDYIPEEGDKSRVFYIRGNPDSFSDPIDISLQYAKFVQADNGAIAADVTNPGRLYGTFVHKLDNSDYAFYFSTTADNGISWTPFLEINLGINIYPEQTGLFAYGNIAHIATEQKYRSSLGLQAYSTTLIWYHQYNAATGEFPRIEQVSSDEKSTKPDIWGGGNGKYMVWTRGNTDNVMNSFEPLEGGAEIPTATPVPTNTPVPTPTPPSQKPSGSMQIGDGESFTMLTKPNVKVTLNSGTAEQYVLWNTGESEPTTYSAIPGGALDSAGASFDVPWTIFTPSGTDSFPCTEVTVNGKLKYATTNETSDQMSASVTVDPGVDADVIVKNPAEGDWGYTNQLYYLFDALAREGECSRLARVQVGELPQGTALSAVELSEASSGVLPLIPGTSAEHTILVKITDGVGHTQLYTKTITVDTDAPQLTTDNALLAAPDTTDTVAVELDFTGILASDDMYGTQTGEDKPFWGVWLANSREVISATNTAQVDDLNWQAFEVKNPKDDTDGYTFTVSDWSLFEGLAQAEQNGGDFYVYARVMDGAGNASTDTLISNKVTLSDNFTLPPTPKPTATPVLPLGTPTPAPDAGPLKVYLPVVLR